MPEPKRLAINAFVRRVGTAATAVAAVLWLWAALVQVSDEAAAAQTQVQWMADLNRYGSAAAVVAAICALVMFLLRQE